MKKIFLSTLIVMNLSLVYAESPGSFRGKETHGFGFGIEGSGIGGVVFYDYAINSDMQIHALAGSGGLSRGAGSTTLSTSNTTIGATLRYFPSENYGFYLGAGGGMISTSQTMKQNLYSSSSGTRTLTTTESTYSGLGLWADLGWQGYDGYYFTIGAKVGTSMKLSEDDKTEEIIDVADHKSTAKSDWESYKSPTGLIMTFGWHF